jgi:peroxiredoxin
VSTVIPDPALFASTRTAAGASLADLAARGPLLVVFLRHFGCPLCREMVADLAARRDALHASGTSVVVVHMHPESQAAEFFARYGAADFHRVSDPDRTLYQAFQVPRARPSSWLSLAALRHYLSAIFRGGHRPALVGGDLAQMSAVFRVVDGRIERAAVGSGFDARADFDDLLTCPIRS